MASTYSSIKIELIATGEQSGTWGDITNVNLGTALEEAIVGRATANFPTDADLTLTLINANISQVARNFILNVTSTGSLTTTRNLIVPTINKPYLVENNTTGGQSIIVKTSSGTGITVPNGKTTMVYANSVNVVSGFDYVPSLAVGSSLSVTGSVTATGGFSGALTGNVTGNVTGNLTGNVTGDVSGNAGTVTNGVYLNSTQTLTNKTISADNNTLSGIAASSFVLSNGSGNIDGSVAQKAIPAGVVVGTTDTQTLTNKRVTQRVVAAGSTSGTITPTGDTADVFTMLGLTGAVTVAAPSGTPTNGQKLILRIKDNGTARALTWTTTSGGYRGVGSILPPTTFVNKVAYVGCIYNSTDNFWDVVAYSQEA